VSCIDFIVKKFEMGCNPEFYKNIVDYELEGKAHNKVVKELATILCIARENIFI
jgi:hypothetical protein